MEKRRKRLSRSSQCRQDAVDGAGDDAAGIAGSFAAGVKSGAAEGFEGFGRARDTNRRRGAGLAGEQQGIVRVIALHLAVESREGLTQARVDEVGQQFVQRRRDGAWMI